MHGRGIWRREDWRFRRKIKPFGDGADEESEEGITKKYEKEYQVSQSVKSGIAYSKSGVGSSLLLLYILTPYNTISKARNRS